MGIRQEGEEEAHTKPYQPNPALGLTPVLQPQFATLQSFCFTPSVLSSHAFVQPSA